jgi:uncharacterized protein YggE
MQSKLKWTGLALLGASLAIFSGCSLARAQATPQDDDDEKRRTISVSGTGSVRVKPDLATATLGTSKSSAKLPEAKSAADASIAQIKAALKRVGVADDDIQTVQFQIYRVQANPQAGIRESSWKVVHMLNVRTKKPDSIAGIVDAAVAAGATDVQNIGFSVDSLATHRVKARELAIKAAQEKAQQLASLLKIQVGEVVSVTEVGDYYPMAQSVANFRMDAGEAMGGDSGIMGGQIEVTTSTQVVFGIR